MEGPQILTRKVARITRYLFIMTKMNGLESDIAVVQKKQSCARHSRQQSDPYRSVQESRQTGRSTSSSQATLVVAINEKIGASQPQFRNSRLSKHALTKTQAVKREHAIFRRRYHPPQRAGTHHGVWRIICAIRHTIPPDAMDVDSNPLTQSIHTPPQPTKTQGEASGSCYGERWYSGVLTGHSRTQTCWSGRPSSCLLHC